MQITRSLLTIIIAASASMVVSCGGKPEAPAKNQDADVEDAKNIVGLTGAQIRSAGIEVGKIESRQISGTIKANGILDVPPQQLVSVSIPLGGFLKTTTLLEGSRVRKGQVIATIENLEFIQIQQDYLEARSQLELAKADYERQQRLADANVNSQKTLQQSRSNFLTWTAKTNGLKEKLEVIHVDVRDVEEGNIRSTVNLYAPIDGYVTQVNGNVGKFMNPSDVLFEIVDTEHLHAELIVFEKDVPRLKIGQKVRFTLANENTERMATVYLIGRQISDERTVQIHCHIDREDKELLPGMYLSAQVETGGSRVPALPDEAVIDFLGQKYIFVAMNSDTLADTSTDRTIQEQRFAMVEVQTSNSEMGYTEVAVPDSVVNAPVVVKGAYAILSKMKNSEEE